MLTVIPECLATVQPAVKQLYWQGSDVGTLLAKPKVAVVGSRKPTAYGRQTTRQFVTELVAAGVVIISGLALGIDSEAHRATLEAGGTTIAVLPGPLDNILPGAHNGLARKIVAGGGGLLTEYPAGKPVFKLNFVARNRIVAGLADAVLIPEATEHSGSRHTATFALELGRPLFAVPGNLDSPTSVGTNNLLKSNAALATSADDILLALGLPRRDRKSSPKGSSPAEQQILQLMIAGTTAGEELLAGSGLPVNEFNQALTMLEISGKVHALGANRWAL